MLVGFFMILVDATIVAVANPSIMAELGADYDTVIWVTSAYLLAYAVPLLLAGRLGDRFGPKNLYLVGLTVFTAASLWCGLAGSIETLIAARVVQGIGAALLTPQTLSTITRIFPPERRGVAMSLWGATAGVATLVGPLAGGVLVDRLGWQWIFFVNVPIGIIGLGLAVLLIPVLPTQKHRFDMLGVLLSGVGMLLIVFALQEGQSHQWAPWIWGTIAGGLGFMAGFVYWQSVNAHEPLIPLRIFRDRDFSLSNVGIAVIGFAVTAMILPVMFYAQAVCGLSPTRSALLTAPMAIATGLLAPFVGKIVDRSHPRPVVGFGFSMLAIALTWLSIEMTPTTPIWRLVLPMTAMGVGMAFIWSPLAATATRNLPPELAGAGSGVYNATRQVGSVLGSASMAAFMTSRLSAEMPLPTDAARGEASSVTRLPDFLHEPFAAAMSHSTLLPAFIALFGVVAALFLLGFGNQPARRSGQPEPPRPATAPTRAPRPSMSARVRRATSPRTIVSTAASTPSTRVITPGSRTSSSMTRGGTNPTPSAAVAEPDDDWGDTEPMNSRAEHPLRAPAETWHSDPVESWHSLLADRPKLAAQQPKPEPPGPPVEPPREAWRSILDNPLGGLPPTSSAQPIGFAHNGFHVDDEQRFQPLGRPDPARPEHGVGAGPARHKLSDDEPDVPRLKSNGRHSVQRGDGLGEGRDVVVLPADQHHFAAAGQNRVGEGGFLAFAQRRLDGHAEPPAETLDGLKGAVRLRLTRIPIGG
jgi:EmrB/QacA subfamily drug resistance transporter